jgi:hypothetical protein
MRQATHPTRDGARRENPEANGDDLARSAGDTAVHAVKHDQERVRLVLRARQSCR